MMMRALIIFLSFASTPAAFALPESDSSLKEVKSVFEKISKKSSEELESIDLDESTQEFVAKLDESHMISELFSEEEGDRHRIQTIKNLSWAFSRDQLQKLPELVKRNAGLLESEKGALKRIQRTLELALRLKQSGMSESQLQKAASDADFFR